MPYYQFVINKKFTMNDFKRGGQNFGGGRDRGRGFGGGGGRSGGRPDMHKAVCSDCGKNCEVPFRPSGDKPVFCSDCFQKQGGAAPRDRESRNFGDRNSRPSFNNRPAYQNSTNANTENYKAQFEQLNSKLDKILKVVASIVPAAPVVSQESKVAKTVVSEKPDISKEIKELKALAKKTSSAKPKAKKAAEKKTGKKKK